MNDQRHVRVWDPLVRVFHWTLVAAFFTAYLSEGEPEWLHTNAGYLIVILLGVRLVWGLVGTRHARFSDFLTSPFTAARYLVDELVGRARRYLGHNPAGGWMVIALMLSLLATTLAGMALYAVEEGEGPLAGVIAAAPEAPGSVGAARLIAVSDDDDYEVGEEVGEIFEEVHEFFANFTLFLVGLHVAGVALGSFRHRENLVASMWHGYKRRLDESAEPQMNTDGRG